MAPAPSYCKSAGPAYISWATIFEKEVIRCLIVMTCGRTPRTGSFWRRRPAPRKRSFSVPTMSGRRSNGAAALLVCICPRDGGPRRTRTGTPLARQRIL